MVMFSSVYLFRLPIEVRHIFQVGVYDMSVFYVCVQEILDLFALGVLGPVCSCNALCMSLTLDRVFTVICIPCVALK